MKKKFFDIIPPNKTAKEDRILLKSDFSKSVKSVNLGCQYDESAEERADGGCLSHLRFDKKFKLLIFLSFVFGVAVFYCFSIEPKTEIEITWETTPYELTTQLSVSSLVAQVDPFIWYSEKTIPGEFLLVENLEFQEFIPTGIFSKEEKAKGIIRVFNNYSSLDQPLLATTRFISDDGKMFRTQNRVVIPGNSFIDIEVVADRSGEDYNIGPSIFSIPGFAGTAKYTAFYGKSFESMVGGEIVKVAQIKKIDIENAEKFLIEKAFYIGNAKLKEKFSETFNILEEAIKQEKIEFFCLAEHGQNLESFTAKFKAKTGTIGFRGSDLEIFMITHIVSAIPENKKILENSLEIDYSLLSSSINFGDKAKDNKIDLEAKAKMFIYDGVDIENIKKRVQGKDLSEIRNIFKNESGILRVRARTWPFWIKTVVDDLEQIEILDRF